jgi:hypothetical protein
LVHGLAVVFCDFGNGLEAFLSERILVVVDLLFDDTQESFIKFKEGLDLFLVLGIDVLKMVNLLHVLVDGFLKTPIFLLEPDSLYGLFLVVHL